MHFVFYHFCHLRDGQSTVQPIRHDCAKDRAELLVILPDTLAIGLSAPRSSGDFLCRIVINSDIRLHDSRPFCHVINAVVETILVGIHQKIRHAVFCLASQPVKSLQRFCIELIQPRNAASHSEGVQFLRQNAAVLDPLQVFFHAHPPDAIFIARQQSVRFCHR